MKPASSLRLRLSVAAAGLIALALLFGGAGVFLIFDAALDRRTADELNHTARLLAGQVTFGADRTLAVEQTPADPRYAAPYGGLYWQVTSSGSAPQRSRSLWDKEIRLPDAPQAEMAHHATIDLAGPDGGRLIAVVRTVQVKTPPGAPLAVITVAMDRRQLEASRSEALRLLAPSLAALALVLSLAMAAFIHRALLPFRALRADLGRVHDGLDTRLQGDHAAEVRPLVDDLNRLLALQEEAIGRARTQAGDMAHGLKTPLAVLDALARRLADEQPALAAEIDEQSQAMQRQATRSLARARSAAASGLAKRRSPVAPVVEQLVAALSRLGGDRALDWTIEIDAGAHYPASEGDVLEMLGNLLDNARKWARSAVRVRAQGSASGGLIVIEDDGPGMAAPDAAAIERGRRWDEETAGTGFGLAIARDLAAATGGRLELARSDLGGLCAAIRWTG
ncbi:HAMP domain-containing sensor histidine kinase [Methylopila sp. M107]|uniref:sensor histidine kinase n=1 Tax=Methylopila sp. M107 TaxID=1101190 RepID=UPI00035C8CDD|nr:HAMP domain-containing sensor histidine kinase [Methylopila sp. M107]